MSSGCHPTNKWHIIIIIMLLLGLMCHESMMSGGDSSSSNRNLDNSIRGGRARELLLSGCNLGRTVTARFFLGLGTEHGRWAETVISSSLGGLRG